MSLSSCFKEHLNKFEVFLSVCMFDVLMLNIFLLIISSHPPHPSNPQEDPCYLRNIVVNNHPWYGMCTRTIMMIPWIHMKALMETWIEIFLTVCLHWDCSYGWMLAIWITRDSAFIQVCIGLYVPMCVCMCVSVFGCSQNLTIFLPGSRPLVKGHCIYLKLIDTN